MRKRLVISLAVAAAAALTVIPSATPDTSRVTGEREITVRLGDFVIPQGMRIICQYRRFSDGKQLVCTHRSQSKTIVVYMLNGQVQVYDGDQRIYSHGW